MTDDIGQVPQVVKDLAYVFGQVPVRWSFLEKEIIILFENGQKEHFPRPVSPVQPRGRASKEPAAPVLQKLPVKRGRKS